VSSRHEGNLESAWPIFLRSRLLIPYGISRATSGIFQSFIGARMYLVFGLAVLAAFAEGLGITMLLPLLQSLDGLNSEAATGFGAMVGNALDWLGLGGSALAILLFIAGFFLLKGAFLFLAHWICSVPEGAIAA
jgi:hypothetical protein